VEWLQSYEKMHGITHIKTWNVFFHVWIESFEFLSKRLVSGVNAVKVSGSRNDRWAYLCLSFVLECTVASLVLAGGKFSTTRYYSLCLSQVNKAVISPGAEVSVVCLYVFYRLLLRQSGMRIWFVRHNRKASNSVQNSDCFYLLHLFMLRLKIFTVAVVIARKIRVVSEWWIGNGVKESGPGLIWGRMAEFAGTSE
jgi:hypothetical protein